MIIARRPPSNYDALGWPDLVWLVKRLAEGFTMISRRLFLAFGAAGLATAGGVVSISNSYSEALAAARKRVESYGSKVIESRFGPLEYAEAGTGEPVLMIHGSGGGCDQGMLFAAPLVEHGMRVISPSRFGYLGSAFPADPSSENQADALVDLLDALGIDRVPVIGGSAGALSAIAFAIRHPDRCSALIAVVPAAYVPNRPPARPWGAIETSIAKAALRSDFIFWAAIAGIPEVMIGTILATDPKLLDTASAQDRARVEEVLRSILPVSDRADGLMNDMQLAGNPQPMALEEITAPTLAISLEDDRYLTADAARHIAASVAGAKLVVYPTGGHVWIGHDAEMFAAIGEFIRQAI